MKEQQLLDQLKVIQGLGTIPDTKSYVLEHPAGRDWREFHTVTLKWIGGIAILGMLALLAIFYLWRGSMKVRAGFPGTTILRFNAFERFVHWLTAVSFIILGITGLNITFGRSLLLPWMGPEAFSTWAEWAKYSHNYLSFAFTLGVVLMFLMWVGEQLPDRSRRRMGQARRRHVRQGRQHARAGLEVQRRPEVHVLDGHARRRWA